MPVDQKAALEAAHALKGLAITYQFGDVRVEVQDLAADYLRLAGEVERLKADLKQYAGWSPHQFLNLRDQSRAHAIKCDERISSLEAALAVAREDSARLDWLEARRQALNRHYDTEYGWKFVSSHNVNRLFVRDCATIDLSDAHHQGTGIRTAIDASRTLAALEGK